MDENITNVEVEEEPIEQVNETPDLKTLIEERMSQIRTQSMLVGSQAMCKVILSKIYAVTHKPGKISMRAYERLIKDLTQFCEVGLSRTVNLDGTTSPKDEAPAEDTNE
jgi:hypothetical protein